MVARQSIVHPVLSSQHGRQLIAGRPMCLIQADHSSRCHVLAYVLLWVRHNFPTKKESVACGTL